MNGKQYKRAIEEFGLSQGKASKLFAGRSHRTGRRWTTQGPPYPVSVIIAMMQDFELSPADVASYGQKWSNGK